MRIPVRCPRCHVEIELTIEYQPTLTFSSSAVKGWLYVEITQVSGIEHTCQEYV